MLVMDTPRPATFRGKRILTAHLLSTLPGGAGTAELLAFAKKLGMKAEWIQHRGGYNEHFDLMGTRCQAAREAGALVNRAVVARTIREKRTAIGSSYGGSRLDIHHSPAIAPTMPSEAHRGQSEHQRG